MTLPLGFGGLVEGLRRATVMVTAGRGNVGSGVIVGADGTIVTNAHVVTARQLQVQLWDGRSLAATVRSHDRRRDLALLEVAGTGLPAASLDGKRQLRVGEIVIAVGNPFGFLGAVTTGVVHAVGSVPGLGGSDWVQSDLQLAPGNSGGPLADATGNIVGINTMIVEGRAFAVPARMVKRFLSTGESRAVLGVVLHPVRISMRGGVRFGLAILEVVPGSSAEAASLLPGDILVGIGDWPLHAMEDLEQALDGEGEHVLQIQFLRGGRAIVRKASVLLGSGRSRAA